MRMFQRLVPSVVALFAALVYLSGLVVAAEPATPDGLPPTKGGFSVVGGAATTAAELAPSRPALAVTERRYITPYNQIAYRRIISPVLMLAVTGQRVVDSPLASTSPERRYITPTVRILQYGATSQSWQAASDFVYVDASDATSEPSLDFVGLEQKSLWVAFTETRAALNNVRQVFVAAWLGAAWQVLAEPVNLNPSRNAGRPVLKSGAGSNDATPSAWVAWEEETAIGQRAIIARRYITPTVALRAASSAQWEQVGAPLNVGGRQAGHVDLTFSAQKNAVPWLVWHEEGGGRPSRVFAARGVADAGAPGGLRWQLVGRQANCAGEDCALFVTTGAASLTPQIASGALPTEAMPTPWITFVERGADGRSDVRVMRLALGNDDDPADDYFAPVGPSVNASCLARRKIKGQSGADPDIEVVGNVPHVTWTETQGTARRVYVCHLLDARPNNEIWDLDTDLLGAGTDPGRPAQFATLASDGETPYVAWAEQAAAGSKTNLVAALGAPEQSEGETSFVVAQRSPPGGAWGTTYPPFMRCPGSKVGAVCVDKQAADDVLPAPARVFVSEGVGITTSCDHVNGWRKIQRIEFALYDRQTENRVFFGKYVGGATPAEGRVYVEDPAHPGMCNPGQPGSVCLGDVTIGTNRDIELEALTLSIGNMTAQGYGPVSPALDVNWIFRFKRPADYVQALNIVYTDEVAPGEVQTTDTDLFQVGAFSVSRLAGQLFLPLVRQER